MIKIDDKLAPFSLIPGATCLVPGTCWEITAYPTLLQIGPLEVKLGITGPVDDFILQQDLMKNCVWVAGRAREGFYRLRIEGSDSGFHLYVERGVLPINGKVMRAKDRLHLSAEVEFSLKPHVERLSLGNHKAQDWDQVQKRGDLREILPALFCLGQKIPPIPAQPLVGTARLLELPEERDDLARALLSFFKAAFKKILIPRLIDDQHQGLVPEEKATGNPYFLLQEGAKRIRSLFFEQNERRIAILPHLPIPLDAGRMVGLQAPGIGTFDLEWSKKTIRRLILRASTTGEVVFTFKGVNSYRLNKKKRHPAGEPLLVEANKTYLFDQFHK